MSKKVLFISSLVVLCFMVFTNTTQATVTNYNLIIDDAVKSTEGEADPPWKN